METKDVNRQKLWILISIAWITPQILIEFLPENLYWINFALFALFGSIILFEKSLGRWLISHKARKEKGERKMKFRCCFPKCKFKNEPLLNILKHMEIKHKMELSYKTANKKDKGVDEK